MKLLYSVVLSISIASCGGNTDSVTLELTGPDPTPAEDVQKAEITPDGPTQKLTNVAALGRADAQNLLATCTTESLIRSALLEINAKRYRISTMANEEVADEYLNAFLDELRQRGDTLYQTLSPF